MSHKEQTELQWMKDDILDVAYIGEATARPEWKSMSPITYLMSYVFPLNDGRETKWTVLAFLQRCFLYSGRVPSDELRPSNCTVSLSGHTHCTDSQDKVLTSQCKAHTVLRWAQHTSPANLWTRYCLGWLPSKWFRDKCRN